MRATLAVGLVFLTTGCASPYLTRRHTHASLKIAAPDTEHVTISVFVTDVPPKDVRATLTTLSDRGQAAFVKAIASKSESSKDLLGTLGENLGESPPPGLILDKTRFQRRLVLTAERSGPWKYESSDRIHYLRYNLSELSNATFISWDKFSTEYADVDLGKISLSQSISGTAGVNAGPVAGPATPVSASATATASRNLTEELSLRQRRIALTGILRAHEANLLQQGIVGIDLAGNATVDIDVRVTPKENPESVVTIPALKDKNGAWLTQDRIDLAWSYLRIPANTTPVTFKYMADYLVRHVCWNKRSIIEGDDWVELVSGQTPTVDGTVLVDSDDLKDRVWLIVNKNRESLDIDGPDAGTLQFASFESARAILDWIRSEGTKAKGPVRIANRTLRTASGLLAAAGIDQLTIASRDLN